MPDSVRPRPSVLYRWTVLVFVSLAMGGNYYIYDSINPLERIFIDRLGFSATQFGWLNASYSVAAALTLLIGGIVIDRIGTKKAITFFAVLCLAGAVLTAIKGQPGTMIAGRTVLGLGAESLIVAVSTALANGSREKSLVSRSASISPSRVWRRWQRTTHPPGPTRCFIPRARLDRRVGGGRCCLQSVRECSVWSRR